MDQDGERDERGDRAEAQHTADHARAGSPHDADERRNVMKGTHALLPVSQ